MKLKQALLTALLLLSGLAFAETSFERCNQFFFNGIAPIIFNQETMQPRALCFNAFAILHSGTSHTPIYVAERLNKQIILDAQGNERTDQFFEEARLPSRERSHLDDYRGSGYDRGHMAPAADMATDESMSQSFSLANVVPQNPTNNRKAWASIEKATRKYVLRAKGDIFVITGPVFDGAPPAIGDSKVWVPQHLFKLVYDSSSGRAWAHWLDNDEEARPSRPIDYQELVRRTGIEFLPGVVTKQ